jgi:hypothetical protein
MEKSRHETKEILGKIEEIARLAENIVNEKLDYFKVFRKIAQRRGQFKNELWLRGELVYKLSKHSQDMEILTEYDLANTRKKTFDVFLKFPFGNVGILMKEFANSTQPQKNDIDNVLEDIEKAIEKKIPTLGIVTLRSHVAEEAVKKMKERHVNYKKTKFQFDEGGFCLLTWCYFPHE